MSLFNCLFQLAERISDELPDNVISDELPGNVISDELPAPITYIRYC